ncbi:MAG: caspase family protein [Bacteroidales bacterium]|nr:caspase family protein [Bacteroidales bacterium]
MIKKRSFGVLLIMLSIPLYVFGQIPLKKSLSEKKHKTFCVAYSPDGNYLATGAMDKTVVIWNVNDGTVYRKIDGLKNFPYSLAFDANSEYLAFGGQDRIVTVYDIKAGEIKYSLEGHKGDIKTIDFSPNNKYIASSGDDKIIKLWDFNTGFITKELVGHTKQVNGLDFNSDGTRLVSCGADERIILWNVEKGVEENSIVAHTDWVMDVEFSPDQKFIASCGYDKIINIWDANSLELINTLRAHKNRVMDISFSPDGNYLISGGQDNRIVLFDLRNGSIVFQSPKQDNYVLGVAFNPNGKDFTSVNLFGDAISMWDATSLDISQKDIFEAKKIAEEIPKEILAPKITWVSPTMGSLQQSSAVISIEAGIKDIFDLSKVEVFINDKLYSTDERENIKSDIKDNALDYKRNVFLKEGKNSIKIVATNSVGSTKSEEKIVIYKLPQKPQVAWVTPVTSSLTTNLPSIDIATSITSNSTIEKVEVYINSTLASTDYNIGTSEMNDYSVSYEKNLTLQEGVNTIELVVVNNAGTINSTPMQVTYQKQEKIVPVADYKAPPNPYRFALIIGNEDYSSYQVDLKSESDVEFAKRDAEAFHEYAIKYLGVPEDQAILKINARYIEMRRELKKISGVIEMTNGKAEVFFYYAGHGFPDEKTKEPYLVPVDGSGTDLEFSAIKLDDVYAALTEFPSKRVTVFIDACFSGGGRNQGLVQARAVKVKPKEVQIDNKMVVFTASSGDETSLPYKEKEHGMFTYFLLQKIEESRGNITYKELSDFIREQVGVKSYMVNSKKQEPQTNISPSVIGEWEDWKLR